MKSSRDSRVWANGYRFNLKEIRLILYAFHHAYFSLSPKCRQAVDHMLSFTNHLKLSGRYRNIFALEKNKRTVFILSADHSGSTWLAYVLGSHSKSVFLGEFYRGFYDHIRQPCAICSERGLSMCELLHGIEKVPRRDAYKWIYERSRAQVFVDSSKVIDWPSVATDSLSKPDLRFIHLIRDPRGWLASRKRRTPDLDINSEISLWINFNESVRRYTKQLEGKCMTVFYEDLASDPESKFEELFKFVGLNFDPNSLDFWNHSHHGFANNGATSMVLQRPNDITNEYFCTGDSKYYNDFRRMQNLDERWKTELTSDLKTALSENCDLKHELAFYNKRMTCSGLSELEKR